MTTFQDTLPPVQGAFAMNLHSGGQEVLPGPTGTFIVTLTDAETGEVLQHFEKKNIITRDCGILAAMLFRSPGSHNGINGLAVGTGATGNILSPDAPDNRQRKLNSELARKAIAASQFRTSAGVASAIPTNVVDFTTVFATSEANGALTEMGLVAAVNPPPGVATPNPNAYPTYDTAVDVTSLDILVNYLTFPVVAKTSATVLTITWRLSF
jgi:hypothetical protein